MGRLSRMCRYLAGGYDAWKKRWHMETAYNGTAWIEARDRNGIKKKKLLQATVVGLQGRKGRESIAIDKGGWVKRQGHHSENGNYLGCDRRRSSKMRSGTAGGWGSTELPPSRSADARLPADTPCSPFSHSSHSKNSLFRLNSSCPASVQIKTSSL